MFRMKNKNPLKLISVKELSDLVSGKASKKFKEQLKKDLKEILKEEPVAAQYRAAAQNNTISQEGKLEVDDGAVVSMGDDKGAYVQAWLWVSDEDAGIESDDDESRRFY